MESQGVMRQMRFLLAICLCVVLGNVGLGESRPNIIVLFCDDLGWADLGANGVRDDVNTPHLDALAKQGARFTAGYITAPQCSPSRAGLLTGRYQQRFGFDTIPDCPLPLDQITLADRLKAAGYATGMVGKWHLDPNRVSFNWAEQHPELARIQKNGGARSVSVSEEARLKYSPEARGFDSFFNGEMNRYWVNYDFEGRPVERQWVEDERFRVDVQTQAALAFLKQQTVERPFFLYLPYFAPHTPLGATEEFLARFPGEMPERRRYALAMMAGVDDGVGRIQQILAERELKNTLIIFLSDNGAPLKLTKIDSPVNSDAGGWDGSLNEPHVGEKGMLSEGGIRVPFVMSWPGEIPSQVYSQPVISLDIAATAVAAAGIPDDTLMDGVNLLPYLKGEKLEQPHEYLYWRFWNQTAIRDQTWKLLRWGSRSFLFRIDEDRIEQDDVSADHPDVVARLEAELEKWCEELTPAGIPEGTGNGQEIDWYRFYFGLSVPARSP